MTVVQRLRGAGDEGGTLAVVQATWLLALTVLLGLALLDVGALLRGARVATAAADGAALAAATATRTSSPTTPGSAAERTAAAHGAVVTACTCTRPPVTVAVRLPVETRLLAQLGITEVRATATARLVRRPPPPAGPAPPSRIGPPAPPADPPRTGPPAPPPDPPG